MERVVWRPKQTGRSRPFLQPILEIFQVSAWDGSRGSHAYLQQRFLRSGDPANCPSADSQLPQFRLLYGGEGRIEPAVNPDKSGLLDRVWQGHGAFYRSRWLVAGAGIESAANPDKSGLLYRFARDTVYLPTLEVGGRGGDRTRGQRLMSPLLYH